MRRLIQVLVIAAIFSLGFAVGRWGGNGGNGRYQVVSPLDTHHFIARLDTKTGKIEPFFMPDTSLEIVSVEDYIKENKELITDNQRAYDFNYGRRIR